MESPDRKAFERLEEKQSREKRELVNDAHMDALIDDILRDATADEFRNLQYSEKKSNLTHTIKDKDSMDKSYNGRIGGHDIEIKEEIIDLGTEYDTRKYSLKVDSGQWQIAHELNDGEYTNPNIIALLKKIESEREIK